MELRAPSSSLLVRLFGAHFYLQALSLKLRPVQFADHGLGVFMDNVDEGVALTDVYITKGACWQAGLALKKTEQLLAGCACFGAYIHVQASLVFRRLAALWG